MQAHKHARKQTRDIVPSDAANRATYLTKDDAGHISYESTIYFWGLDKVMVLY